jgi:RNA polymerase sigma-70 factor (ECF subfamily)
VIAPHIDGIGSESDSSDEILMRQIQERDNSAIDQLYRRHREKLKGAIYRIVQDDSETQDVLQETFLQVWNEAASYSPKLGRPLGWMMTIGKRRAIDRVRRRHAYSRAKDRFELFVAHEPRSWLHDHIDADVTGGDLRRFLETQIQRLPIFQRQAVQLAFFEGLSHREIASATRTPLGTIKTRLELGMRKLVQGVRPHFSKI